MTRTLILCVSPAAFAAGLLLVQCSSSSSHPSTDGGHADVAEHKDAGHSSGSSEAKKDGGASKSSSESSKESSGSSSSRSSKDAGDEDARFNAAAGDTDASCKPPEHGRNCTPGEIVCADKACAVPANECCQTTTDSGKTEATCDKAGTACAGMVRSCAEAADCGDFKACCLDVTGADGEGTTSCKAGPPCPKGAHLGAQICRSREECKAKECIFYDCGSVSIEACEGTLTGSAASTCTKASSGSGSSSGTGTGTGKGSSSA